MWKPNQKYHFNQKKRQTSRKNNKNPSKIHKKLPRILQILLETR